MNFLDIIIIVLLLAGVGMGIQRGFLRTSLDLIVLGTAAFAGAMLYRPIGDRLGDWLGVEGAGFNAISLVLGAIAVMAILNMLISWAVTPHLLALRTSEPVRIADSGLGVIPGMGYGILFGAMLTLALGFVSLGDSIDRGLANSNLATHLRAGATAITTGLAQRTEMDLADFTYVVVPESDASYRISPVDADNISVEEAYEFEMIDMVNRERADRGISTLTFDPDLVPVARAHSREMLELGYFAHTSPNTGTLADRLSAAGVGYTQAGENLAYAPTLGIAHRGLMQSEGHRANILEPGFQRIGIGIVSGPDGTLMVTQVFAR
jgi:uncharacterized protein YkwD/uncharacterized membrane protein required for colicin V production